MRVMGALKEAYEDVLRSRLMVLRTSIDFCTDRFEFVEYESETKEINDCLANVSEMKELSSEELELIKSLFIRKLTTLNRELENIKKKVNHAQSHIDYINTITKMRV